MNFESGSEQRNNSLDALKQRQKASQTMPTLTGQQANVLYTMPLQTVERLEQVLRSTLALQETIRAGMDTLATRESLEPLATEEQLSDWLAKADEIHREICQDLRQTVSEMKEEGRQAGKRREEFMRQLSGLEEQFRRNWDEASARFQGKILLTLLVSGILSATVSVLMWRLLL